GHVRIASAGLVCVSNQRSGVCTDAHLSVLHMKSSVVSFSHVLIALKRLVHLRQSCFFSDRSKHRNAELPPTIVMAEQMVHINVVHGNRRIQVIVDANKTSRDVRLAVVQLLNLEHAIVDTERLVVAGNVLDDNKPLSCYGTATTSEVRVRL